MRIVELMVKHGGDVHAKDKGGLVPLHNACSYGHYEVANLLIKVGALGFKWPHPYRLVAAASMHLLQLFWLVICPHCVA